MQDEPGLDIGYNCYCPIFQVYIPIIAPRIPTLYIISPSTAQHLVLIGLKEEINFVKRNEIQSSLDIGGLTELRKF